MHHAGFPAGLPLDIGCWPICGMNVEAPKQFCAVQDGSGISDADSFGYSENAPAMALRHCPANATLNSATGTTP